MICRHEAAVLEAASRDAWSDELRDHLAGCDHCVAAASVAPWMHRFAQVDVREHRLPDASIVWLKAKLLQGTADMSRISRPMDIVQMIAYLCVAGGWASLMTWKWSAVSTWLKGLTPSGILLQNAARSEMLSMSFFAMVLVLASITVMLALHTILAEE